MNAGYWGFSESAVGLYAWLMDEDESPVNDAIYCGYYGA